MPKPVNNEAFEEAIAKTRCEIVSYEEPISQFSLVNMRCFCGKEFSNTRQNLRNAANRKDRIVGELSCGCMDKKWSNARIDELVSPKQIRRLTNCDIPGFQPSVTKLDWKCLKCEYEWKVAVDSIANKNVGCPRCAGNLTYTADTLQKRLLDSQRTDIIVLDIIPGTCNTAAKTKKSPYGTFKCSACENIWEADIHNVIKFGYGCPSCNDNISTRVYTTDGVFRSKLEHYFWETYARIIGSTNGVQRQVRYNKERRFTCDFVLPDGTTWVEISGKRLLLRSKYAQTIDTKQQICESKNQTFVVLTSIPEIHTFLYNLKENL